MSDVIIYRGEKFSIGGKCEYYISYSQILPERLLHRFVWLCEKGEIKSGYHIHHIDENILNNHISNLEIKKGSKHISDHMKEMHKDKEYSERNKKNLDSIRWKAAAWHSSPEGVEFHKRIGKLAWENKSTTEKRCSVCRGEYETFYPDRSKYCSTNCSQVASSKVKRHSRNCKKCNGEFFVSAPSKKNKFCSRSCAARFKS